MGRTACTEPQCLYSTAVPLLPSVPVQYSYTSTPLSACTVQLHLYSPQCLYSTAIPLLPLWTVRPVQSLSACTVQLYLYTSHGQYRASVPLQVCILNSYLRNFWEHKRLLLNSFLYGTQRYIKYDTTWSVSTVTCKVENVLSIIPHTIVIVTLVFFLKWNT